MLIAGRAVDVPSVDEIASQKNRFISQLWKEDRDKMGNFKPDPTEEPGKIMEQFNKFMQDLADEREKQTLEFAGKLNEERRNRQAVQEKLAFTIARISPTATFSLVATNLANTSIRLGQHFVNEATNYQKSYARFIKEKTGMNMGGHVMMFRMIDDEQEEPEAIDPHELPEFQYNDMRLNKTAGAIAVDFGILAFFNLVFFMGAFVAFLRYDVR